MLDDVMMIRQRDRSDALGGIAQLNKQTLFEPIIHGDTPLSGEITHVIMAGMGGSALAADMIVALTTGWLHLPITVVKGHDLPGFVNNTTLVLALSHSGNTEETLSCYEQAQERNCPVAVMTTGGELFTRAENDGVMRVQIPSGVQPRMSIIYHLRGLLKLLQQFLIIDSDLYDKLGQSGDWIAEQARGWLADVPLENNFAKQLAQKIAGKTPVFYAGELTWPLAYKWKISWNENAKNVAFCSQYPECNHNEFIGWSSHPVEKPFAVVDLVSSLEKIRIRERMALSDRLLSGMRPHAISIDLQGDTLLRQLLWGIALADAVSIYVAILNGVDPAPVKLVERFKQELNK